MPSLQIHTSAAIDRAQWQALADAERTDTVGASWFQTPACYDFYTQVQGMEAFAVGVSVDGKLQGVACGYIVAEGGCVKQYLSRRAIIPSGVLLYKQISEETVAALLYGIRATLQRRVIYIEMRNFADYTAYREAFVRAGFTYRPHYDIHADITDITAAWESVHKNKQWEIRRSQEQVAVYETKDAQDVKQFYRMLEEMYCNKVRRPLFAMDFFYQLWKNEAGHILIAKRGEEVVGGMALIVWGEVAYEWFVCGDDDLQGIFPSSFITWKGMHYAAEKGCKRFDYMGAGSPDKAYGVRDFKLRFGGALHEYGRFIAVCSTWRYRIGVWAANSLNLF